MASRLFACPSCARHIRAAEPRCPFCGEACPNPFATATALVIPPRRPTRAAMYGVSALATAGVVGGMALASVASCSDSMSFAPYGAPPDCDSPDTQCLPPPEGGPDSETDAAETDGDASPDTSAPDDAGTDAEPDGSAADGAGGEK